MSRALILYEPGTCRPLLQSTHFQIHLHAFVSLAHLLQFAHVPVLFIPIRDRMHLFTDARYRFVVFPDLSGIRHSIVCDNKDFGPGP